MTAYAGRVVIQRSAIAAAALSEGSETHGRPGD